MFILDFEYQIRFAIVKFPRFIRRDNRESGKRYYFVKLSLLRFARLIHIVIK